MHGSLVTSSLIRETTENESANEGYRFGLFSRFPPQPPSPSTAGAAARKAHHPPWQFFEVYKALPI
jgi:hypothetical protein